MLLSVLFPFGLNAQQNGDTLQLSLNKAEEIFLQNNLQLLAGKYNVQSKEALTEQARLWDNPQFSVVTSVYDNLSNQFFKYNAQYGSINVQLQQLITTAGKRKNLIQLTKSDAAIEALNFKGLMQNLRYALRDDYYKLATAQAKQTMYVQAIDEVNKLITAYDNELTLGNISLKENLRVKALLYDLQNESTENINDIIDAETEIKTLLALPPQQFVVANNSNADLNIPLLDTLALYQQAMDNSANYALAKAAVDNANVNVQYQKSLGAPDINVIAQYDRNNSFAQNVYSVGVGLPLPVFNRNQGNVRSAKAAAQSGEMLLADAEQKLKIDINSAISRYLMIKELMGTNQSDFFTQYDTLFQKVNKSLRERQISLLDYIDFLQSYKETRSKFLDQQYQLQKAVNDLNLIIGK